MSQAGEVRLHPNVCQQRPLAHGRGLVTTSHRNVWKRPSMVDLNRLRQWLTHCVTLTAEWFNTLSERMPLGLRLRRDKVVLRATQSRSHSQAAKQVGQGPPPVLNV